MEYLSFLVELQLQSGYIDRGLTADANQRRNLGLNIGGVCEVALPDKKGVVRKERKDAEKIKKL